MGRGKIIDQEGAQALIANDQQPVQAALDLPTGNLPATPPSEILSLTTLRPGQYFSIRVDGGATKRIEIETDDTLGFLSFKIKRALGSAGTSTITRGISDSALKIEARNEAIIEIIPGPDGFDALAPLGLRAAVLYGEPEGLDDEEEEEITSSIFELGFNDDMSVLTKKDAADAGILIDNALREIRKMFRYIAVGPEDENARSGLPNISAADAERIAQMQAALGAITGLVSSMNLTNQMRSQGLTGGSTQNMLNIIT
ncbi:MAG: hypothetical protein VCD66_19210 [Alphaproteobacteria bacterium]